MEAIPNTKQATGTEAKQTIEVRCPMECGCSPRGKLLATLIDVPLAMRGNGVVIQVACPAKKSRLHRIAL